MKRVIKGPLCCLALLLFSAVCTADDTCVDSEDGGGGGGIWGESASGTDAASEIPSESGNVPCMSGPTTPVGGNGLPAYNTWTITPRTEEQQTFRRLLRLSVWPGPKSAEAFNPNELDGILAFRVIGPAGNDSELVVSLGRQGETQQYSVAFKDPSGMMSTSIPVPTMDGSWTQQGALVFDIRYIYQADSQGGGDVSLAVGDRTVYLGKSVWPPAPLRIGRITDTDGVHHNQFRWFIAVPNWAH